VPDLPAIMRERLVRVGSAVWKAGITSAITMAEATIRRTLPASMPIHFDMNGYQNRYQ